MSKEFPMVLLIWESLYKSVAFRKEAGTKKNNRSSFTEYCFFNTVGQFNNNNQKSIKSKFFIFIETWLFAVLC